jgi:hypothetical protein
MKASRVQIAKVLEVLRLELAYLGRCYVFIEQMVSQSELRDDHELFVETYIHEASWRGLLIGLAGMLSTDQESITLGYLMDLASNHPYDFKYCSAEQLKNKVDQARKSLESLDKVESRLRAIRDRRLAHVDRKLINEPEAMHSLKISNSEAHEVLLVIEEVFSTFYRAFHGEEIALQTERHNFQMALDEAIGLDADIGKQT